ncbi:hypothetical protein [Dactylosporangium salmoneum]|uniref:PH domain-containing protein n=1 Tax=Dactylosporangium salmoneum TaxID=53361 RepID=A0ABP5TGW3_9ACTN
MTSASRFTATCVAVAAFGYSVLHNFVLQPLTWRIHPDVLGACAGLVVFASIVAVPVVAYLWLTRRLRPRPATFTLSTVPQRPAFVVPESPAYRGVWAIALMVMAGNLIPAERVPNSDHVRLSTLSGFVPVLVLSAVLLAVAALAFLWLPTVSILLTPTGVTVRYLVGARNICWQDLFPGGPPSTARWTMPLRYHNPIGRAKDLDVLLLLFHVDREFLATAIRHYAERPEHRPDIGTSTELERLRIGFQRWRHPARAAQT